MDSIGQAGEQRHVILTDPVNSSYQVQLGEVRSRGFELEARTRVGRDANLIAAYAYTDARITRASPLYPEQQDQRRGATP